MIEKPITKSESGCQTDTHILEHNIVKDYEWNEWELRRKALKLVSATYKTFSNHEKKRPIKMCRLRVLRIRKLRLLILNYSSYLHRQI